jgi:hypothetical protein
VTLPRQRSFLDEHKLGGRVVIHRHRHGWENGHRVGVIEKMTATLAFVIPDDDPEVRLEIEHPRDITSTT